MTEEPTTEVPVSEEPTEPVTEPSTENVTEPATESYEPPHVPPYVPPVDTTPIRRDQNTQDEDQDTAEDRTEQIRLQPEEVEPEIPAEEFQQKIQENSVPITDLIPEREYIYIERTPLILPLPKTLEIEDYGTPLGVDVMINHVGDCFD